MKPCTVTGCERHARSMSAAYCETHYYQIRRNGYLGPKARPDLIDHSAGYKMLKAPKHRLTTEAQQYRVYEHRAEFYEHFGEGPFHCKGCGIELRWDTACVCRETGDKADNRIGNLEIRCRPCTSKKAYEASKKTLEEVHYRWVEWNGERKTATEWSQEIGMKPGTFLRRLNAGWSVEKIMTTKKNATRNLPRPSRQKITDAQIAEIREMMGHFKYEDIANVYGVGTTTIGRVARGQRAETERSLQR
jgi:hypothetical protein